MWIFCGQPVDINYFPFLSPAFPFSSFLLIFSLFSALYARIYRLRIIFLHKVIHIIHIFLSPAFVDSGRAGRSL